MIIFMSGFPFAGKSVIARAIASSLPAEAHNVLIDPKAFRCDDFESLNEENKRTENLSIWEVSLDLLAEQIKKLSNKSILIYDTACASRTRMEQHFRNAKKANHKILYLFVQADLEKCAERAGDKWLPDDVVDKYIKNFEENVPAFKKMSDKMMIIQNNSDEKPNVSSIVEYVIASAQ